MEINIKGLPKAAVLAALYNQARTQGMGVFAFDPKQWTAADAQPVWDEYEKHNPQRVYFDYVKGRVMKVNLTGDSFDPWLYDRDNGQGSAERAIDAIRE